MKMKRLSATGNTFVVVETEELSEQEKREFVLKNVAELDGVIFVENTEEIPKMVYFNRDGSRAAFCGNGARAFLWFLHKTRGSKEVTFKTDAGILHGEILDDGTVLVEMPTPLMKKEVNVNGQRGYLVEVGVPHLVIGMGEVDTLNFAEFARPLRFRYDANVNAYKVENMCTLKIRTYERGVERETRACGSGAVAVAFVYRRFLTHNVCNLNIVSPGGILKVCFKDERVYLGGGVKEWKKV